MVSFIDFIDRLTGFMHYDVRFVRIILSYFSKCFSGVLGCVQCSIYKMHCMALSQKSKHTIAVVINIALKLPRTSV